ncbi:MAG: hypothetical protein QOK72_08620, partial [Nitrososphaeraceae archaeon]|nr:hypothetical protein [Nitrososphaeraceae archaeon]
TINHNNIRSLLVVDLYVFNNYYIITSIVNALANNIVSLVIKHIMENNGKFSFQFYIEKR